MTTRTKLEALAANLWWSWNPEAQDLFRRLNADVFTAHRRNPKAALSAADEAVLADPAFVRDVDEVYDTFAQYMEGTPEAEDAPRTSYFCMEFGLHESLPLYSGGLGILAGDHAKTASDLGIPFTAVGLFLRDGYFRQYFDDEGWQQDEHVAIDPDEHPLTLTTDAEGDPLTVTVHLGEQPLELRAWHLPLGRTNLYLLDSDLEANPKELRGLTRKLYQGGNFVRLQQEIILGIGGLRLLRALGVETDVYHLNEGHCAFLTLELLREQLSQGRTRTEAEAWVREQCVFTTHTPVPAGHDRFKVQPFNQQMRHFRQQLGLSTDGLLAYGRANPDKSDSPFTMTVLGLKLAREANGVSKLNGHVARQQWHEMYPERSLDEVPIGHVTNGVHLPTWTAPHARAFLSQRLGNWLARRDDPAFWAQLEDISDEGLWHYRSTLRGLLLDFAAKHNASQSLTQPFTPDPDALTIGFARRFATYKRAPLLFTDVDRAAKLFADSDRPLQIFYAGKAHPEDEGGKRFIQQIIEMTEHPDIQGHLLFLENYNMEIGRMLVSGCDVWLNNPRRPYEASGTSGQKISAHGGLNLSIADGWWPEGYNGDNGWVIGPEATGDLKDARPPEEQDRADAEALYTTLEEHVIPEFYDRDAEGFPRAWIARMREAMMTLPHAFSAKRMVKDYLRDVYRVKTEA